MPIRLLQKMAIAQFATRRKKIIVLSLSLCTVRPVPRKNVWAVCRGDAAERVQCGRMDRPPTAGGCGGRRWLLRNSTFFLSRKNRQTQAIKTIHRNERKQGTMPGTESSDSRGCGVRLKRGLGARFRVRTLGSFLRRFGLFVATGSFYRPISEDSSIFFFFFC